MKRSREKERVGGGARWEAEEGVGGGREGWEEGGGKEAERRGGGRCGWEGMGKVWMGGNGGGEGGLR